MADLTVRILGDASNLKREFGNVESFTGTFKTKLGGLATGIAGSVGAAFAAERLIDFGGELLTLGNQTENFRRKTQTVFEGAADGVRRWADANNEAFGVTDDQLAGLAANFGDLLKPMGFTADQAATMSKDVIGLSGALSAWSGGTKSAAEVSEILAAAMLGEREQLKSLGISISEADVKQRLLEKGQDKLTGTALQMAEAAATQELIFEKSTDAQRAWADGSSDSVKKQNELKAKMSELKEELAMKLLPAFNAVASWLVDTGIPAFEKMAAWVEENWPKIRDTIVGAVQAIQDFVAPIVEGLQLLWEQFGDNLVEFTERSWGPIKQTVEGTLQAIKGLFDFFLAVFRGDWSGAWDAIKETFDGVWNAIQGSVRNAFEQIRAIVKFQLEVIAALFGGTWNNIVTFFADLPGRLTSAAGDMFGFIREAFKTAVNWIIDRWNGLEFEVPGWDPPGPGPTFGGFTVGVPDIPRLAGGGIVRARPGGTNVIVGEGGRDEAVIPLDRGMAAMGGGLTLNLHVAGSVIAERDLAQTVKNAIIDLRQRGYAV